MIPWDCSGFIFQLFKFIKFLIRTEKSSQIYTHHLLTRQFCHRKYEKKIRLIKRRKSIKEETENWITQIQILKIVNHVKIFIIKTGKSTSIISAEEDGLIKSFHLATSIFFEYIYEPKRWYFCQILTTYVGKLRPICECKKRCRFSPKAAISGCFFHNIMIQCSDWEKRGAGLRIKANIYGADCVF